MIRKFLIIIGGLFTKKVKLPKVQLSEGYVIEEAKPRDIDFVYERIVEESKAGHFNDSFQTEDLKKGICYQAFCSVHLRKMPNIQGALCDSVLSIIKYNNTPVGFVWCREFQEAGDDAWELYLTSMHPKHRGNSIGLKGIEYMLKLIHPSLDVYARLYTTVPNRPMIKILKSLNFKKSSMSNMYMAVNVFKKSANK